jgi:heterodisulfide reductase subunit C
MSEKKVSPRKSPAGAQPGATDARPDVADARRNNPYAAPADNAFRPRSAERKDIVSMILEDPRMVGHTDGFQSCIQCGICTSGCPAARFTDYSPREIARRALDGDETLLTDDSVWYCYYCYTCQSRCPRKNSVAVINQVIRGYQVEHGHGAQHVEMFVRWCQNFYDDGMGGDPHLFFPDIMEAFGPKWKEHMEHLLEVREQLGLGPLFPDEKAVAEVRTIMEETGFKARLESLGAWGARPAADSEE